MQTEPRLLGFRTSRVLKPEQRDAVRKFVDNYNAQTPRPLIVAELGLEPIWSNVLSDDELRALKADAAAAERKACVDVLAYMYYRHIGSAPGLAQVRGGIHVCSTMLEAGARLDNRGNLIMPAADSSSGGAK